MKILEKPMTEEELKAAMDEDGFVTGRIAMSVHDIINHDLESFLDDIAIRLCGSDLLMNISYKVTGVAPTDDENADRNIVLEVTGDVTEVLRI